MRLLKDPLTHFLLAGLALFLIARVLLPETAEATDPDVIVVDRNALLDFVQFRTRQFDSERAAARLDAMSAEELEQVIDDYVREEALHREALALGLEREDYVIRRRLIQKIEFMAEALAPEEAPDERALRQHFEENRDGYARPPTITFAHVFFNADKRGAAGARSAARQAVLDLNEAAVDFAGASAYGDRFLYHRNYVERSRDDIASHFGPRMAEALFEGPGRDGVGTGAWSGPYESSYGAHVVQVSALDPGGVPTFEDARANVVRDLRLARVKKTRDSVVQGILERYDVRVRLQAPHGKPASGGKS